MDHGIQITAEVNDHRAMLPNWMTAVTATPASPQPSSTGTTLMDGAVLPDSAETP